eukprot:9835443-Lingulodinium_polyedra.AAC.1
MPAIGGWWSTGAAADHRRGGPRGQAAQGLLEAFNSSAADCTVTLLAVARDEDAWYGRAYAAV